MRALSSRHMLAILPLVAAACAGHSQPGRARGPDLDAPFVRKMCIEPDSVLLRKKGCTLRDQSVPREFFRKP
jgi:hypothetical protein